MHLAGLLAGCPASLTFSFTGIALLEAALTQLPEDTMLLLEVAQVHYLSLNRVVRTLFAEFSVVLALFAYLNRVVAALRSLVESCCAHPKLLRRARHPIRSKRWTRIDLWPRFCTRYSSDCALTYARATFFDSLIV
jgi:hypothetical protein